MTCLMGLREIIFKLKLACGEDLLRLVSEQERALNPCRCSTLIKWCMISPQYLF